MIEFYRARIGYFYSGTIEQVEFDDLDENVRKPVNTMIDSKTEGQVDKFMNLNTMPGYLPPMISFGANFFKVCGGFFGSY